MKTDFEIMKEVFTTKNILLGVLFNIIGYGSMYGFLEIILYLRYDLGWI
jgi:hypothetical protein